MEGVATAGFLSVYCCGTFCTDTVAITIISPTSLTISTAITTCRTHSFPRRPRRSPSEHHRLRRCLGVQRSGSALTSAAPPLPSHREDLSFPLNPSRWRGAPARGRLCELPASAALRRERNRLKQTLLVPGAARGDWEGGSGSQPPARAGVECQNLCVNFVCMCFDVPLRNGTSYGDHRDGSGV